MSTAMIEYRQHLVTSRRNKPRSADDTIWRLETFFPDRALRLRSFTESKVRALYEDMKVRPKIIKLAGGKTKQGDPMTPDSCLDILSSVKTFLRWCASRQYLAESPAERVVDAEAVRNHGGKGRSVLRRKELRKLLDHAIEQARGGDERALGVLFALVLGMRSSEIVRCQVRDVDDHDWIIEVPFESAKTKRSERMFAVPPGLRSLVARAMRAKQPEHHLFGGETAHDRGWVTDTLETMCAALRFPRIETAHGLRGAHNDLLRQAGIGGDEIIRQLGHESESTTLRSYTSDEGRKAIAAGASGRVLSVLTGGKKGRRVSGS